LLPERRQKGRPPARAVPPEAHRPPAGASRVEQVHENLAALGVLDRLDDEVMARIETALG
jgi:aryl-alcohol dehydrogenase-like predicted oxidoreductase